MLQNFRPLGDLQELTELDDRVLLAARRGVVEITALPGGLLRVRVGRRKRLPAYESLAVLPEYWLNRKARAAKASKESEHSAASYHLVPTPTGVRLEAEGLTPELRGLTPKLRGLTAQVDFRPLALSFARSDGAAFAADWGIGQRGEQLAVHKSLGPNEHVYGLGEKTGWLDKRHRRYQMRNTDVFLEHPAGIGNVTDPLYASFPVFAVHGPQGSYGLFVDNPEFTQFDFTFADHYEFSALAGALTYYVLPGPSLPDVLRQYTHLTGRISLPPLWALGYHQCRWGYASEADIRRVAAELRQRDLPADAVWFDIDYMDGYRVFTWDRHDFPDPRKLIADLKAEGFRAVTIVDPGVKVDRQYAVYRDGRRGGHFIKHGSGKEYHGSVWPGRSAFPDFHHADTRAWWAGHVERWLADYGVAGIWNDMNEPAATDLSGPISDALHAGGKLPHAAARNTYALEMARATHLGMIRHDADARPFILTRAAFSGAQRVAALWCGDNSTQWEHLAASLPMLMNLGLSGMPLVGVDIGGFMGDTDGELLARWTQAGAFYPFCRNHAAAGTNAHEPWAFGPEVEAICRKYLALRYQLLPYFYNLCYEAAQTGAPLMRPLVWHFPTDPATFNLNDQFMLGPDLLVAPVVAPGLCARAVYLPEGRWHRWGSDDEVHTGPTHIVARAPLDELPLFVRAGAVLPMWPAAPHTSAIDRAALSLHIWPGPGQINLYEDDGETQAHGRGPEGWRLTHFRVSTSKARATVRWGPAEGLYAGPRTHWSFVIHGLAQGQARLRQARLDGRPVAPARKAAPLTVRVADDRKAHTLTVQSA